MVRKQEADVVLVGAGLAGLVAATDFVAAGRDVVVLEARDRVGGRLPNTEIGGEPNELGGEWIAPYQSDMHALLAELGIELFHSYRDGDHLYLDAGGKRHKAQAAERLDEDERHRLVLEGLARFFGPRPHRDRGDRARLVAGGVDARRVRRHLRRRRAVAARPGLTRPVGPVVHWACTDLAGVGHMHMEGAIRSGRAAARAILARG